MKVFLLKFLIFSFLFAFFIVSIPIITSAIEVDVGYDESTSGTTDFSGVNLEIPIAPINYSVFTVNNSLYWNGNPWSDSYWLNLSGGNANQNISIVPYNFTSTAGFFDYLGSLVNRITEIFATDIVSTDILTTDLNVTNSANISNDLGIGDDLHVEDDLHVGDDLFVTDNTYLYDALEVYGITDFYNNVDFYDVVDFYDPVDFYNTATFNTSITLVRSGDSILEVETTGTGDSAEVRVLADGNNDLYIYTYGSTAVGTYDGLPKANTSLIDAQGHRFIIGTWNYAPMYFSSDRDIRWTLLPTGHFVPHDDEDYDIGNASKRVRDIYVLGEAGSGGIRFVEDDGSYGNLSMDDSFNLLWNGGIIGNSSFNGSFVSSNYVPYIGATKNVDLGNKNFTTSGKITYGKIINSSVNQIYVENTVDEYIIWG